RAAAPMSLIALTTDFGTSDPWVGIVKGVIATRAPGVTVIDVTHGVPPQDVLAGALILKHAIPYFPHGTIHVVVVDPGVGGPARRPGGGRPGRALLRGPGRARAGRPRHRGPAPRRPAGGAPPDRSPDRRALVPPAAQRDVPRPGRLCARGGGARHRHPARRAR